MMMLCKIKKVFLYIEMRHFSFVDNLFYLAVAESLVKHFNHFIELE